YYAPYKSQNNSELYISIDLSNCPIGIVLMNFSRYSLSTIPVSVATGLIVFTLIPKEASSRAIDFANATTAPFDAQYMFKPERGRTAEVDPVHNITPLPASFM